MPRKPTVRIFISSPSDVRPERLIAERVVKRLNREFAYHFDVVPLLWEREPLTADAHFQGNITPPRETDIVAVILWSRLGVPLPAQDYLGPLSRKPVTGTEWEFEDALSANRERGVPDLLVYRKLASILASLDDDARLEEQRRQKALVEDFMRRWFMGTDGKSFTAAYHGFDHAAEFEEKLENHLRELLKKRVNSQSAGASDAGEPGAPTIRWQGAPFRGLLSFDFDHHEIFFGRTRARNELRELLALREQHGNAFVLVMGASGSGKSSVVKAGLLPDLMLPGMVGRVALCRYAIVRPASVPGDLMAGLAQALIGGSALPELTRAPLQYSAEKLAALLREAPGQMALPIEQGLSAAAREAKLTEHAEARIALVIDQLEELFTQDHVTPAERQSYVRALEALAKSGRVWVIATLRSDFFDRLETLPELENLSRDARYLLTPASAAELGQIIRQPARLAGVRFEHDAQQGTSLDETILQAAADNPGALPLLSFLLDQLWQGRTEQGVLTYAQYRQLGGLEGALGRRAEEVFQQLAPPVQQALAGVLRTLVTVTQDDAAVPTARTVSLAQFPEGTPGRQLVQAFLAPEARLLIAFEDGGEGKVRVAHEALLTHWARAKEQIQADLADLQMRARLEQAQARWREAVEKDKESLLLAPGLPLSEAEDLAHRHKTDLPAQLHDYIGRSAATARQKEKRKLRLLQAVAGVLAVFLIAAGAGAWFGFKGQREAQEQARVALARQLAAQANELLDGRGGRSWTLGALLAIEARALAPDLPIAAALFKARRQSEFRATLLDRLGELYTVAISPDGKTLATSFDNTVRLWDVATQRSVGEPLSGHGDGVLSVAFSPDGRTLATVSRDKTARLWDVATRKPLGEPLRGHESFVQSVAFSPDSKTLATGSADKTVRLWDVATRKPAGEPLRGHEADVFSVAFSPDGNTLATGSSDKTLRLWDVAKRKPAGEPLLGHEAEIYSVAFSPDGKTLATGSLDRAVRLWDVATRTSVSEPLRSHQAAINSVAFSPDGSTLATGGDDFTIRLWDVAAQKSVGEPLRGHDQTVRRVMFSTDGKTLATASFDNTVRLWDLASQTSVSERLRGHEQGVMSVALSPDGKTLATGSFDKTARLWDMATRKSLGEPLRGHAETVFAVAFSPDRKTLATGSRDKTVRLWDVATQKAVGEPLGHEADVFSIAFSPDGKTLATGSGDKTVRLWDVATQKPVGEPLQGHETFARSLAFSPDGKLLATGSTNNAILLWDVATRKPAGEPLRGHEASVLSARFSADGKTLATGSSDKTARLWNVATRKPVGEPLRGHEADVFSVAFSADGKTLATGSGDRTVRLWDVATRKLVGEPLRGHEAAVLSVRFSADGKTLAAGSDDKTLWLWDIDFHSWPAHICSRQHRNLTVAEWREFIGDVIPYRKTCPNLPEPRD